MMTNNAGVESAVLWAIDNEEATDLDDPLIVPIDIANDVYFRQRDTFSPFRELVRLNLIALMLESAPDDTTGPLKLRRVQLMSRIPMYIDICTYVRAATPPLTVASSSFFAVCQHWENPGVLCVARQTHDQRHLEGVVLLDKGIQPLQYLSLLHGWKACGSYK